MPRITGASIAEHVQQQESAILDAAARLFATQGFAGTDLADIAAAVGLARSSLYRYFPDKDHILLRWFERELEPVVARSEEIVAGPGTPTARLAAWLDFQLGYVTDRDHDLAPTLAGELSAASAEVQAALGAGHARLYATLTRLIAEALGPDAAGPAGASSTQAGTTQAGTTDAGTTDSQTTEPRTTDARTAGGRDPVLVSAMIGGLLQSAAHAVVAGGDAEAIRVELQRSARAVLGTG